MAKGQQRKPHESKKPKQDKSKRTKPLSAYAQSMAERGPATPSFGKKK